VRGRTTTRAYGWSTGTLDANDALSDPRWNGTPRLPVLWIVRTDEYRVVCHQACKTVYICATLKAAVARIEQCMLVCHENRFADGSEIWPIPPPPKRGSRAVMVPEAAYWER
jgi:hypothetical protein